MRVGDHLGHGGIGHEHAAARHRKHDPANFAWHRLGVHACSPFEPAVAGFSFPPVPLLSLLTCIQRSMGSELSSTAIMVSTGTSSRPANSIDSAGEAGSSR